MKLIIKPPKPRNPHALAARQRQAGAHDAHHPKRHTRRTQKQTLKQLMRHGAIGEYEES